MYVHIYINDDPNPRLSWMTSRYKSVLKLNEKNVHVRRSVHPAPESSSENDVSKDGTTHTAHICSKFLAMFLSIMIRFITHQHQ